MKRVLLLVLIGCATVLATRAQEAGGSVYGKTGRRTSGVVLGNLTTVDPKDSVAAYYLEANVLINVKADEYMAVFGLAQEGASVIDGGQKVDAQLNQFTAALEGLGIKRTDIFVDFIAQNRIYDYVTSGSTITEKLSGFEVKKNVAVRYAFRRAESNILSVT